jgi:hypothetical protein
MSRVGVLWLSLALAFGWAQLARGGDQHIDVSQIIDKSDAESILEEPVRSPTPRNVEGGDGYYSKCNYYGSRSAKALILRVYQAGPGHDPQKELEAVEESSGAMRAIPGLGDKARLSSGVAAGLPPNVVMLYVIKGNTLITIGLSGLDDEASEREKVKRIAQSILAHL